MTDTHQSPADPSAAMTDVRLAIRLSKQRSVSKSRKFDSVSFSYANVDFGQKTPAQFSTVPYFIASVFYSIFYVVSVLHYSCVDS